ncbi:MAG: TadE/TadG family type IV pilus assembly protein [Bryobacteraceae bacterium]
MSPGWFNRRSRRGNALIEFALAFAVMAPLLSGAFQFGYAFFAYNRLQSAVRGGARYASVRTYDSNSSTPSAAYQTAVKNMVLYGNPSGGTQPVVPGLTPAHVEIAVTMDGTKPETVRISIVNYQIYAVFKTDVHL